jgi:hypothetical protein
MTRLDRRSKTPLPLLKSDGGFGTPFHAALDMSPDCDAECGQQAAYIAHIHRVHGCSIAGLTPDGAAVLLLCGSCLSRTAARLGRGVAHRIFWSPERATVGCHTCGRPLHRLADVLETEAL